MSIGPMFVVDVLIKLKFVPSGMRLPIALGAVLWCVNQILPSGPAQIAPGELGVGTANSVMVMSGPLIPIAGGPPPFPPGMPPMPVVPPVAPPVVVAPGPVAPLEVAPPAPPVAAALEPAPVTLPVEEFVLPAPPPGTSSGPVSIEHAVHEAAAAPTANAASCQRFKREAPRSRW